MTARTPRRVALLVNPTAGNGDGEAVGQAVAARLRTAGLDVISLRGSDIDHAAQVAAEQVADGVDHLVVLGGDGMTHVGLNATAGTGTSLGLIPRGTGNDFARALGLPRSDPLAAADIVVAGHVTALDAGRIVLDAPGSAPVWFATVLAVGFDSRVAARARSTTMLSGNARYVACVVAELKRFLSTPMRLTLDGLSEDGTRMLVAIGNTSTYGGGLQMCAGADPTDGWFSVVEVSDISRLELLRLFPKLYRGTHLAHPAVTMRRAREVRLEMLSDETLVGFADGEPVGALPLTATCEPGALRMLVPPPS
ncbi:MAG TPA: YegS/Rv2252/BmrU family lipid kinase [Actinopolymorphaceae bacterium]